MGEGVVFPAFKDLALIRSISPRKSLHIGTGTAYLASPAELIRAGRDAFLRRRLAPRRGPPPSDQREGAPIPEVGISSVRQAAEARPVA